MFGGGLYEICHRFVHQRILILQIELIYKYEHILDLEIEQYARQ